LIGYPTRTVAVASMTNPMSHVMLTRPTINFRVNIDTDLTKSEGASEDWNHPGVGRKTRQCNLRFDRPRSIAWAVEQKFYPEEYRGVEKSLARPGTKQALKQFRDERDFSNIETRAVIKFFFLQGKAPKEIHAILTEILT